MADETLKDAFAAVLAKRRHAKGLSQQALADACDLHFTFISQLERGKKVPTLGTIVKLAEALGCRPHRIVLDVEKLLDD